LGWRKSYLKSVNDVLIECVKDVLIEDLFTHNVELTGHRKDCPKASDPETLEKAA